MIHFYKITFAFLSLLLLASCTPAWSQQNDNTQDVLRRVKSLIEDFDSIYTIEPARAKGLISQALLTSKKYNFDQEHADSYLRLGRLHLNIGRYDSARHCIEKALEVYKIIPDKNGISYCFKDLGNVYVETGDLEKSFDFYTKGLNLARQNKYDELIGLFINNIGLIYLKQEHFDRAQEHFEESASLSKKGYSHALAINNIGVVKQKQERYDEAIKYYHRSLEECHALEDEYCALSPLSGLGAVYLAQNNFEKALEANEHIIKLQEKLGLTKDLLVSYNRMGLIYGETEAYYLAIFYFNKSLKIARHLNSGHIHFIHANLSNAYESNNQYREALKHNILFYKIKDSISSVDYKIRTDELLKKYESAKNEKEIELLKKDQKLKQIELENKQALYTEELLRRNLEEQQNKYELLHKNRQIGFWKKDSELQQAKIENKQNELERQTYIRNVAIGSAVLIFIPTFILMVVYQQKVRNKELLALKTEEVNKQRTLELLRSFEIKTIKANIEGQEKEKQRLAKELHDGVAGSLAGIKMRFQALGALLNENNQINNLMQSVDEVYREVRTISHHLTPPGMLHYSFVEFIKKYLDEISEACEFEIEYIFHGEKNLNQLTDDVKVEVYRILQELLANVVKHAKTDLVEIQLIKNQEGVNLIVEDRGKGFEVVSKLSGMGLYSIKSRVDALGGQLNIDSVSGRGTIVNVEIPID